MPPHGFHEGDLVTALLATSYARQTDTVVGVRYTSQRTGRTPTH